MQKQILKFFLITIFFFMPNFARAADFWFESGTTKIRQDVMVKNQATWQIKAAKNEFEPFQLVIKNDTLSSMANVDVTISDFTGANGTIKSSGVNSTCTADSTPLACCTGPGTGICDNVTIFKEEYLNIVKTSTTDGQAGYWPDALLPKVDAYYNETHTTFPFSIAAGWVQPIWFDVFVPSTTMPGDYSATVTVTENSSTIFTGTINLSVWNFALPATASYESSYGSNSSETWAGYTGAEWLNFNQIKALQKLYIRAGLRHRLTLSPMPITGTSSWNTETNSYTSFSMTDRNESLAGYNTGTNKDVEYGAVRTTSSGVGFSDIHHKYIRNVAGGCAAQVIPQEALDEIYARALLIHDTLVGQGEDPNNFYVLPLDEPGGGEVGCAQMGYGTFDYTYVKAASLLIKQAGLKVSITSSIKPQLLNSANNPATNDYFDRWEGGLMTIVGKDWEGVFFDKSEEYADEIAAGRKLWWYHGCMEGGCAIIGDSFYDGFTNMYVEYPAMRTRIFPWMSYKYGPTGEIFWATQAGFAYGWIAETDVLTYVSSTQFSFPYNCDPPNQYSAICQRYSSVGTFLHIPDGTGGWKLSQVASRSYNAGVITVTMLDPIFEGLSGIISGPEYTNKTIGDPFLSVWSATYGANGDGQLFYPGVPNKAAAGLPNARGRGTHTPDIGGTHNIPIESIRLKMIREGLEDYEYLKKLKDLDEDSFAKTQIANIATNTFTFSEDENIMYAAREALANRILGNSPDIVPPSAPTGLGVM